MYKSENKKRNKEVVSYNKRNKKKNSVTSKKIEENVGLFTKIKNGFNRFKKSPKQSIINFIEYLANIISENRLFVFFVLMNTVNGVLLRILTMGNGVLFDFDALLADMTFSIFVGAFAYLFNEKGRFIYLEIVTVLLSLICVLNSAYYTFKPIIRREPQQNNYYQWSYHENDHIFVPDSTSYYTISLFPGLLNKS